MSNTKNHLYTSSGLILFGHLGCQLQDSKEALVSTIKWYVCSSLSFSLVNLLDLCFNMQESFFFYHSWGSYETNHTLQCYLLSSWHKVKWQDRRIKAIPPSFCPPLQRHLHGFSLIISFHILTSCKINDSVALKM